MKIYCPCEKGFDIEYEPVINLDKEPGIINKIKDGTFLTFRCPSCGQDVKPELKTRIEWPSKKQVLLFVPEAERFSCLSYCAGLKQIDLNTKKEIRTSYVKPDESPVIGYGELMERIKLITEDLNIPAVETLKFFIIENGKEIEGKQIKFFFHALIETGDLQFYVYGLKKDEVAVMNIPHKLYRTILGDMKKDKKNEIFKAIYLGNYISYQNIYTEGRK